MKISELIKKLQRSLEHGDYEVVVSGADHSYFKVGDGCRLVKAEAFNVRGSVVHLLQYEGDDNKSNPSSPIVNVFWIDNGKY